MKIPDGKYCEGCPYLDVMLYLSCQFYTQHVETDGEARHTKIRRCVLRGLGEKLEY